VKNKASADVDDEQRRRDEERERDIHERFSDPTRDPGGKCSAAWRQSDNRLRAYHFTLPVIAIIALAIKSDSFGPVFYRQERVGLNGRRFMLLKFRSMVDDAEDRMVYRSGRRNVTSGSLVLAGLSVAHASMSYHSSLMFCAAT
jgi:hypothetical protein